jgi:hypothetical protein
VLFGCQEDPTVLKEENMTVDPLDAIDFTVKDHPNVFGSVIDIEPVITKISDSKYEVETENGVFIFNMKSDGNVDTAEDKQTNRVVIE